MNNSTRIRVLVLAAAALVAGCASDTKLDDSKAAPVETRTPNSSGMTGANPAGTGQSNVASVDLTKGSTDTSLSRIVYFDYDSFIIKDEFRPVVEAQAKLLTADRKKKVSVEGHTDERGGSEYNLALGQKRAEAVAKTLSLLGAADNQVEAVSFGKERPAVQGSTEEAWAKNRRAELNSR